ncbi:unnamed protein product [Lathyrus sativus]|nr:unnamed protein product [Lathyrus sativus]
MSENTNPRKRLIIKLSYPPGSRNTDENKRRKIEDSVQPIVTCYWVDSSYRTKSSALSQPKNNDNVVEDKKMIKNQVSKTTPEDNDNVVEDKKMIKNQVSNTVMPNNTVVEDKKMIKNQVSNTVMPNNTVVEDKKMIKNQVLKTTALSQPEDNDNVVEDKKMIKNKVFKTTASSQPKNNGNVVEDKKVIKNQVSSTVMSNNIDVENKKQVSKTEIAFNSRKESSRGEECGLKKKPMECVKRRQCWLILKRMMVDRDGWDLKDPPKIAMVDKSESKSKAIGLKDIERKLRLYATPDEFASDIRLVFSNAMRMYPPRNHIYRIAKKFSENFELKWKSLKDTWKLEDRGRSKTHKSRIY